MATPNNSIWSMHWSIKTNDCQVCKGRRHWRGCHWERGHCDLLYEDDLMFFGNTLGDAQKAYDGIGRFYRCMLN